MVETWEKILEKIQVKTEAVNTVRNVLIMPNTLLQMHLKLLQKEQLKKTVKATCNLIGNKISDKITRVLKTSSQNNLDMNEEEKLRERYICPKERQKIIDV